jgi:hypothetical protein
MWFSRIEAQSAQQTLRQYPNVPFVRPHSQTADFFLNHNRADACTILTLENLMEANLILTLILPVLQTLPIIARIIERLIDIRVNNSLAAQHAENSQAKQRRARRK